MAKEEITILDLEKAMKGLFSSQALDVNKREYILRTGEDGMRMFDRAMKMQYLVPKLDDLFATAIITDLEFKSLSAMLISPDDETFILAETLINLK